MTTKYFLIGAGGHGKVALDAFRLVSQQSITVWDDNGELSGKGFLGSMVNTPVQMEKLESSGHVAIGDSKTRRKLSDQLVAAGKKMVTIVHPTASVAKSANVKEGCFIAAYSVVAPSSMLARGTIVNHGAVVDHDCRVGEFSHIAPNATLGGSVVIGERCLIGSGAVVLPGVSIVDDVTVGAGAVVISDIKKRGSIVCGVPANES